ncbi:MAG: peptide-methionine (S)-S-oxide reductase MsrA [Pseudomonadales bacterium]|nr:peptide-methionine (S)-S-oxide reductase MsrA [Pseudomonadales bacterium]
MAWGAPLELPTAETALAGRAEKIPVPPVHFVNGQPLQPPFPSHLEQVQLAMGCFWGAERKFWEAEGVFTTAVGYSGGITPNPTYEEVCSGHTGHTEAVLVVFDPAVITFASILQLFWEGHDPTQGMRQGNDMGTQYRSVIYTYSDAHLELALASQERYQEALVAAGYGQVTTEIAPAPDFFYAEHYHQQYLAKVPNGYCGMGGTGVGCDIKPLVSLVD